MALYAALDDHKELSATNLAEGVREVSGDLGELEPSEPSLVRGRYYGVLYGFWPTFVWTLLILGGLVGLNVFWADEGTLGFSQLDPRTAVESSTLLPNARALLLFRVVCLLLTSIPCGLSVVIYRQKRKEAGEPLVLGGLEILLIFCTLWTWCLKTFYFFLATIVSALYVYCGWVPPFWVTASLWVIFDMAFGMAWLVFWAVWVFLMPFSFLAGQMAVFKEMLTPLPFYYHNANVLLMTLELMFSRWTMNEEHCIFPVYFAYSYLYFNWYLYSKMGVWIYFFLDYNRPSSVPVCLLLCAITAGSFDLGARLASGSG